MDLNGKKVLLREDLNVPLDEHGNITDDTRIEKALESIKALLEKNAAVMLLSHLGRPQEGEYDEQYSLAPVATRLSERLGFDVRFEKNWLDGVDVAPGELVLCENVRFNVGEKKDDMALSEKMAALCDVFVMDAFATAHRAQASTHGVAQYAPLSVAGPLLLRELDALMPVAKSAKKPLAAIVGGSKVSTKIALLDQLLDQVDTLIVGGGIANTLLAASGVGVGKSLYEPNWLERAKALLQKAKDNNVAMPLPCDVVVAKSFSADTKASLVPVSDVASDDMILDVGHETAKQYASLLQEAKTIIWNGPVGVFEMAPFSNGTKMLAQAIADSDAYSVAGGGDTLAAIAKYNVADHISYISTGGGAFLALMQGETLPGLTHLDMTKRID